MFLLLYALLGEYLWPSLRSTGQAIMFYSYDLFIIIFSPSIFEAEERRPA